MIADAIRRTDSEIVPISAIGDSSSVSNDSVFGRGLNCLVGLGRVEVFKQGNEKFIRFLPIFPKELVDQFFNHVVGIGVVHQDDNGSKRLGVASGFVYSLEDEWFLVTVGHFMKDFEVLLKAGRVVETRLVDGLGANAKDRTPPLVDLTACSAGMRYSETLGVDLGFFWLLPMYQQWLQSNGIVPLQWGNWRNQPSKFDGYVLCGIRKSQNDEFAFQRGCFPIFAVDEETVPDHLAKKVPRFHAVVPDYRDVPSIDGMSGGPILAFARDSNDQWRFWIAAMQNGWDKKSRTIAAIQAELLFPVI